MKKVKYVALFLILGAIIFTATNCSEIQNALKQVWEQQQEQQQSQPGDEGEF